MNTTKLIKNFNAQTLESTIANLVNINKTTVEIAYTAFDKHANILDRDNYAVNKKYLGYYEKKCSSVGKAIDKILTAHPNARLAYVQFITGRECVEISFHEEL